MHSSKADRSLKTACSLRAVRSARVDADQWCSAGPSAEKKSRARNECRTAPEFTLFVTHYRHHDAERPMKHRQLAEALGVTRSAISHAARRGMPTRRNESAGETQRMRGQVDQQGGMFFYFRPEDRVPADHPLRAIKTRAYAALRSIGSELDGLYSAVGRPSIAPERLLKSQLLIALDGHPLRTGAVRAVGLQPAVPLVSGPVARRAGVEPEQLLPAARVPGRHRRGAPGS
jgi:hypothetical protein